MAADVSAARPATPSMLRSPQPQRSPAMLSPHSFILDNDLNTIPDPRSRAMSPATGSDFASPRVHHSDLNDEVATLSTKLIDAINHQTTLDDRLSARDQELEEARQTIRSLQASLDEKTAMMSGDVWVRRSSIEGEKAKLQARVSEEKKARLDVEQSKKKIELELENLTAALFEEANKMVIQAKEEALREQEVVLRKNDLLRAQLADTEGLLKSQQEQLAELKLVMEQMSADRDEQSTALTAPSSPGFSKVDSAHDDTPLSERPSHSDLLAPVSPSCPTSFTHLLQPVLRTDLASYEDFMTLVHTTKRLSAAARSRPNSGNHTGLGLALGSTPAGSPFMTPASSSGSLPQTPNTPDSNLTAVPLNIPPLKETKFYKRALAEDIEPTLRLDAAPGVSWLGRRTVLNSMTEGSLVVEPVPVASPGSLAAITKPQFFPCSMCGESRKEDEHLRTHRFRTSESESAQRYPLCRSYCLVRVRAVCDFLGFLRLLKDGHWRADDEDAEKAAWEESVRLREQMFWARIGGGVVPASSSGPHHSSAPLGGITAARSSDSLRGSPRPSQESRRGANGASGLSRNASTATDGGAPLAAVASANAANVAAVAVNSSSSVASDKTAVPPTATGGDESPLTSPPPAPTSENFPRDGSSDSSDSRRTSSSSGLRIETGLETPPSSEKAPVVTTSAAPVETST